MAWQQYASVKFTGLKIFRGKHSMFRSVSMDMCCGCKKCLPASGSLPCCLCSCQTGCECWSTPGWSDPVCNPSCLFGPSSPLCLFSSACRWTAEWLQTSRFPAWRRALLSTKPDVDTHAFTKTTLHIYCESIWQQRGKVHWTFMTFTHWMHFCVCVDEKNKKQKTPKLKDAC